MELVSGRDEFQPTPAYFNATRLYQRRVQAKLFFSLIIISHNLSNSNSIRAKTRELKAQGCNSSLQETSSSRQFTATSRCHESGHEAVFVWNSSLSKTRLYNSIVLEQYFFANLFLKTAYRAFPPGFLVN